ncbi:adenylate kinase isoenzyme 1-like [Nannospalax galili]|uniref:adenylate kinase isoenzyme 1-like n=1 Tax=Nannospalax galili TaxID=1026970 RepID=UPI00111C06E8|nr:adenylate kinase isoenzyme 1-like [Nannospalax galili]
MESLGCFSEVCANGPDAPRFSHTPNCVSQRHTLTPPIFLSSPKSPLIIFVVGGPGCGKGTRCRNMATKYGFCHVGLGQLLWQEAQRSTQRGWQIRDIMRQGLLVPTDLILDMVSNNLLSCPETRGFLIDGFPRELEQAKEFEQIVSAPVSCNALRGQKRLSGSKAAGIQGLP